MNSKKGGEEVARRKLRVERLGEMIAKEVMDVASLLPKTEILASTILTAIVILWTRTKTKNR